MTSHRSRNGLALLLTTLATVASAEPLSERGAELFRASCASCHLHAETGAPMAGDAEAWDATRGFDALLESAINGVRHMPPLGMCGACTESDLRELVAFLSGVPDPARNR